MSQVFITSGENSEALAHIRYHNVLSNSHQKSLEDNRETFDFTTHADKDFSKYIKGMNRVVIPGEDGEFLEFIIYEVQESRVDRQLEVYSYASYAELIKAKSISPHTTGAVSAEVHANLALSGTEWELGNVDFKGVRTITFENYTNPYAYLRRIASAFELELNFRVEHNNGQIIGRYVDLVEKIGRWRGRRVEFGKDLIGLRRIENTDNIVTALRVIGPVREDGTRLEVLVEDKDALERWGRKGQHQIQEYEPQFEDPENATIERLEELGEQELSKRVKANVSYEITIADLENAPGMENKKIRFGDTIPIKDTSYEPALYLDARIYFQDRDIKEQAEKKVILGDFIEYTEEEVHSNWNQLQSQVAQITRNEVQKITYTKPEVDQKVADVVDDAEKAAVEVVDSIEIGGRNIASVDSVGTTGVTRDGYTYTIAKTGSSNPFMRIPTSRFEENKRYVISFKVKKISGNVTSLAGHDQSFRGMPVEIYRDGVRIEDVTTWSVGDQNYPNDNEVHEYEIHLKTPETFPSDDSAPYWYIQPNRPNYGENYELELWNFQIEQATKKSNWERPQDDVDKDIKEAKDEAEEAKQTADNAQQSANGKNTVFYQPAEPSTEGRNEDDLWFDTSDGYKPHRFNGTAWVEAPFGHQAIASIDVGKVVFGRLDGEHIATKTIEAEHIKSLNGLVVGDNQFVVDENGNVSFGGILEGASGRFGEVTVTESEFLIESPVTKTIQTLTPKTNMIKNHSFETVEGDADPTFSNGIGQDGRYYNALLPELFNYDGDWLRSGSPKVAGRFDPNGIDGEFGIFGTNVILVDVNDYVFQYVSIEPNKTYTLSFYNSTAKGLNTGAPRAIVEFLNNDTLISTEMHTGRIPEGDVYERNSMTFTTPSNANQIRVILTSSANSYWVEFDGVQLVEGEYMAPYQTDDNLYQYITGSMSVPKMDIYDLRNNTFQSASAEVNELLLPNGLNQGRIYLNNNNQIVISGAPMNIGTGLYSYGIYTTTTSNAANVALISGYQLARSTSSIKYKKDVEDLWDDLAEKVLELRPIWYRDKATNADARDDWSHWGFIAEEVHEVEPRLVQYKSPFEEIVDEEGNVIEKIPLDHDELEPEGVKYERITVGLVSIVKKQKKQIEEQDEKITKQQEVIESQGEKIKELEKRLARLEKLVGAE